VCSADVTTTGIVSLTINVHMDHWSLIDCIPESVPSLTYLCLDTGPLPSSTCLLPLLQLQSLVRLDLTIYLLRDTAGTLFASSSLLI
jgi:hypothetical protein